MLGEGSFLTSIAAARQEAQTLYEISHDLGNSLSLDETLLAACGRACGAWCRAARSPFM